MNTNTGGSAFPKTPFIEIGTPQNGMTLRDYFAAKAMQGLLAGLLADGQDIQWAQIAQDAHRQADAMLKARKQ